MLLKGIQQISMVAVTGELNSGMLNVENNAIIQTLSHTGSSRLDISNDTTLTVQNLFEVPQNKSMEFVGTDNGTLVLGDKLNLSGILKINASDTLSNGTLVLKGGTLNVNKDSRIASNITHEDDATINVDNDTTLNYTGNKLEIGALTLNISGGGFFENTNNFVLNDPISVLTLNGAKVSKVSFAVEQSTGKLSVTSDSLIETFLQNVSSRIDIASGVRLTLKNTFEIPV